MKKRIILSIIVLSLLFGLAGCSLFGNDSGETQTDENDAAEELVIEPEPEPTIEELAQEFVDGMTTEEKVAQLFFIVPEALVPEVETVTAAGDATKQAIEQYPVGGIIYMAKNLQDPEQTKQMLSNTETYIQSRIGLPMFFGVDEEGGLVSRVACNDNFQVTKFENMSVIGSRANEEEGYSVGAIIGGYLKELGFNVDFAPVADVLTNSENTVVRERAFSSDPEIVSMMCRSVYNGLQAQEVLACYKHFPGHGNTTADSHAGYAYSNKTLEEIYACELIPFIDGIKNEVPFIMVGHISYPSITGDDTPASLSPIIVQELLREELGYKGLIVTDALNMGAISQVYSSGEAAIMAIKAGSDMVMMPENFRDAYAGVLSAVENGELSMERLDESVVRIVTAKMNMNARYCNNISKKPSKNYVDLQ